jgi:5-oxoprolinase (ATP-hydrolysing)
VDQGGTFTDVIGLTPDGRIKIEKLLSTSPDYPSASIEGIRRLLRLSPDEPLSPDRIEGIRFGTTVATNALLERQGGRTALLITKGFADLLEIASQSRPDIFDLCVRKPEILYAKVFEVEERMDPEGRVITSPDEKELDSVLEKVKQSEVDAVAIVCMHSWKNPLHEQVIEERLRKAGFRNIYPSHKTMNLIKIVGRGQSTVVNAYLSPVIEAHLAGIRKATREIPIQWMLSSGGLSHPDTFRGKDALLSGPAGGVIAVAEVAREIGMKGVIGFDMGGTSTDVSRFAGEFERLYETKIGGIELQTEMLNIVTVASGGGSVLWFDGQKLRVGPDSAGATPGPTCYGFGGPLTVTDANLFTGRIVTEYFPRTFGRERKAPLNITVVHEAFRKLAEEINDALKTDFAPKDIALGFLRIANEKMAMAIKEISVSKGFDAREYALVCFGGAGGQHACQVASLLDMDRIVFHPFSSVMSAYGIGLANPTVKSELTLLESYHREKHRQLAETYREMEKKMFSGSTAGAEVVLRRWLDLREEGTETFFTLEYQEYEKTQSAFRDRYKRLFGFSPDPKSLEVVNLRVEVEERLPFFRWPPEACPEKAKKAEPVFHRTLYEPEGSVQVPVFLRGDLPAGFRIAGPALVVDPHTSFLVEKGFEAKVLTGGIVLADRVIKEGKAVGAGTDQADPVLLEVFNNLFMAAATEMGHTLRNTAHSVNIKERYDFSCAVFDASGGLIANAPHIPVHLGSMGDTVKAVLEDRKNDMKEGDLYLTNNPYRGGSHLPDMTVICPVFSSQEKLLFFTAVRGHHADIGGITPGSMPPETQDIVEEGVLADNFLLVREGRFRKEELTRLLTEHPYPVRNLKENLFDVQAQIAACKKGVEELKRMIGRYGWETVRNYMGFIQENAEFAVKKALAKFLADGDPFVARFEDRLDDGTPLCVRVEIRGGDRPPGTVRAVIDFAGTGPYHRRDNLNTPRSVTRSAVLYVVRALTGEEIPLNGGCLRPIQILVPERTLLNPPPPAPVASGNVETSQRIVDVLLGALQVAGASQGTMNNLLFEVDGEVPYYETIAGGSGALAGCAGASGVQVHMTNTRITDPEILEVRHPGVRLKTFTLRRCSGGDGRYPGGDGVIREMEFLKPGVVSILSERRVISPYGMGGGAPGQRGENLLRRADGSEERLPHRVVVKVASGDTVVIRTPGGGGFGKL